MRLIVYGLMLIFLTACGKNEQAKVVTSAAPASDEAPAPAPGGFYPPTEQIKVERKHFYEGKEGDTYFYSKGVSDNERQSGTVANEMLEVLYIGSKDNGYQLLLKNGATSNILSCKSPCDFFTETIVYDGRAIRSSRYKNAEGSIAWAVFSDAALGELGPAEMKINGKMQKAWFSTDKGRFIPLEDSKK